MRISDWSSDVCSSDLLGMRILHFRIGRQRLSLLTKNLNRPGLPGYSVSRNHRETEYPPVRARSVGALGLYQFCQLGKGFLPAQLDRKSVVQVKSVSDRVDPGCRLDHENQHPIN